MARHDSARAVWIVNQYASPPDQPAGTRHFDLARELLKRGHRVTVFAAGFCHLTGRDDRLEGSALLRRQVFDGVCFVWLRSIEHVGNNWRRILNILSFTAIFIAVQFRVARPDVVIGSTVHPFAAFGGWLAARLRRATFVFEIRDLWPQTLVDLGAMRLGSPSERLLRSLEAFLVRRASVVITLLPGIGDYLEERGLPTDHVVYIPNGVDPVAFAPGGKSPGDDGAAPELAACLADIDRLHADGRFVIGYIGTFGRVNRVDVIARAAAIADEEAKGRIAVMLVGDGPERRNLEDEFRAASSVTLGAPIPKLHVPALLAALDATVVHTTATPVYRFGISFNKLFEYMAAGRPVIFATQTAYDPVASSGAGISVHPDDPGALAAAFLEIARRPEEVRAAMGAAGREYVFREHNMATLGVALAEVIEGSTSRGRVKPPGEGAV